MVPSLPAADDPAARVLAWTAREQRAAVVIPDDWPALTRACGDRKTATRAIEWLEQNGWLQPIRRGAWAVRSRTLTVAARTVDLIGDLSGSPHLVTGGYALALSGLSDQAYRTVIVATARRRRDWAWSGEQVHYVQLPDDRLWGGSIRRGSRTTVAESERALLDSLAHPRWGVSLAHAVEALDRALSDREHFAERLAAATARYGNAQLARRVGYLVGLLAGEDEAKLFRALRGRSNAAALLAVGAGRQGPVDPTWRVRLNVAPDRLLSHRHAA